MTSIYGPFVLRSDGSTQSLGADKQEDAAALVKISGIAAIDKDGHARLGMPGKTELVAGVSGAVALCTGEHHECFAQRDGKLVCVGSNGRGQLGTKPRREQDNPDEPTAAEKAVAVPGIRDAASVACGSEHSCVLHRGGRVTCWGSGYQGNLGDGKDEEPGIRRVDVPGVTDAVAIAAAESGWTTCALRKTGALRCWGASYDWMPRAAQQAGFDLPRLAGVTRLQLTAEHICALTSSGQVHCVGTLARVNGPVTAKTWQQVYP